MASRFRDIRYAAITSNSWIALPCAGLLMCLAACGSAAPQAKPVAHTQGVPAGYTEFRDAGRGYSLAVPSSWTQINVQSPSAAAAFANLIKLDPKIATIYGTSFATFAKQDISLLAIAPGGGQSANMVVTPGNGTASAAQIASIYSSQVAPAYARYGAHVNSHQLVKLGGFPAMRISVIFVIGSVKRAETQFLWAVHSEGYVLTLAGPTAATTDEIAGTVRFS
jgi:hypothetical protein